MGVSINVRFISPTLDLQVDTEMIMTERQEWKYGKRLSLSWGRYVIHQAYEVRGCLTFSEVDGVDEKQ